MRYVIPLLLLSLLAAGPAAAVRRYVVPHAHRPAHAASPNLANLKVPGLDGGSVSLTGDPALAGLGLDDASGRGRKGGDPYGLSTDTSGLKSTDASASTTSHSHRGGGGKSAGVTTGGSDHSGGGGSRHSRRSGGQQALHRPSR